MSKPYQILFFAILLISLLVRISRLDFPLSSNFGWGDGTRDFLVASHIVKFGELPILGPYNLLDGSGIKNSPFYFYVLALPLLIYNHPLTLGLINIFLQMAALVLFFLIARLTLGAKVALLALILFSFNPEVLKQSDYIWQPYLMLPVALLALYFLTLATLRKSYRSLILSCITISLAFSLHNSAFAWLMVFLIVAFLTLRGEKKNFKYYLGLCLSVFVTLTLLYLPVIVTSSGIKSLPGQNTFGYLSNLKANLDIFLNTFFVNKLNLFVLLILPTLLYKARPQLLLPVVLFCLPILFASYFNKIRVHYLILSFPIFVILVANFLELIKPRILKLVVIIILIFAFTVNFQFLNQLRTPLENQLYITKIVDKVIVELNQIKREKDFTGYDFFQIKSYTKDQANLQSIFNYPVLDTILLVPLELNLNQKLTQVLDDSPFNHVQINKKNYIVLACFKFQEDIDFECRRLFLNANKNYDLIKTVHTDDFISIYLGKQRVLKS